MRRFLIDPGQVRSGRATLQGSEGHHAREVLRLTPGQRVLLLDGQGWEYPGRVSRVGREEVEVEVLERRPAREESPLKLTLGLALLKADRMDLVVQKATELGVTTLVPLRCARSRVRLEGDRARKRLERWQRIAREALKQCRRGRPVEVRPPADLAAFLAASSGAELKIILEAEAARDAGRPDWRAILAARPKPRLVWALVGPEGGFAPAELAQAQEAGFVPLGLGPRILRSETAALALAAVLGYELGDLA